jgi:hypothetical protein
MEMIGIVKSEQKYTSVWVAWVCIPLLLLFNFQYYPFDSVSFDLTLFYIPAVVALTYRYGWHGFVAALIGSAALLVKIDIYPLIFGGEASLYLIIVHLGWLTLSKGWFESRKSTVLHGLFMFVLLLACSISLYFSILEDIFEGVDFSWRGAALLYYIFFVLGLRGEPIGRWLVVAGLLMLLGIALLLADIYSEMIPSYLHLKESPSFRWTLNKPGDFLTLLMFFWMGNWIRKFVMTAEPLSKTLSTGFKLAISAGILYLLDPMWEGLVTAVSNSKLITDTLHTLSPAGSNYLLPLIALLLSITRRNGMSIVITLVGTYYLLYGIAEWRSADSFFDISFTDFALAIIFAMLGKRIAKQLYDIDSTATASLLPVASATKKSTLKPEDWERQHDEISNTVRRVMLTVLAYSVFCGLTLASTKDASLFGVNSKIELPIAGTSIDYSTFLTVGPLILIGLIMYLHLFLQSSSDLARPQGANPLPYLFNMENPLAIILSGFLHYWLPVLLLFQFAWIAAPQPMAGFWLGLVSIGMGIVMAYLHMARTSGENEGIARQLTRVMFFTFCLLFALQMASGGAMVKRSLMLEGANLENTKLSGANLFGANLDGAQFTGVDLTNVNFRNASLGKVNFNELILKGADLRGADITTTVFGNATLYDADLRGAIGLSCDKLKSVENLQTVHRDLDYSCKYDFPESPQDDARRNKFK